MALGKKTGGRNFGPKNKANPNGRPRLPDDIKNARQINKLEHDRHLNYVAYLPMSEINVLVKDTSASPMLMGAAKMMQKFAKYGDVFVYHAIMDRMIGRAPQAPAIDQLPPIQLIATPVKKTFTEFCVDAGYPAPFPKQIEMYDFCFVSNVDPRLLLGARGVGKTDYLTILGVAYKVYLLGIDYSCLIITQSKARNMAIMGEIGNALIKNGVRLEKETTSCLNVDGKQGKDYSVEALTIRSSFRGRHPDEIVMDDPVTEEDVSEATRALVQRKYNEAHKLTSNIVIIGQPAHAHDLYAKVRPLLKKMEVPHGMIPELDHDLEAQRLAGVDEKSIQASYHLKIMSDGNMPFEKVNYIDRFPPGGAVAWLDPSHKGHDFTALSIVRQHFQGVAVVGFVRQRAWNHCLDDLVPKLKQFGVQKLCIETNGLGDQPVFMMRQLLKESGIGVVGKDSTLQKHAKIMSAGAYAHLIHLSRESDTAYTNQVVQYEYQSKHDDGPDSLASCLEWIGLIRGK